MSNMRPDFLDKNKHGLSRATPAGTRGRGSASHALICGFALAASALLMCALSAFHSSDGRTPERIAPGPSGRAVNPGRQLYVSIAGNDRADGSREHPWATIQHAANQSASGDTVHVAPGHYYSAVTTRVSGTPSARMRFISDTKWGAKVIALTSYTAWENQGDYVDIEGFDITGDGNLGILNMGSFVRVLGNHVHDIPAKCSADGGAGIDQGSYTAHDNDTIGNLVHNIGDVYVSCPRVHGIYHANLRGHVWNNIVYSNQGYGIHLWHAPVDVVVANNLVFHNGLGGITVGAGDAPGGIIADGMVVTNNIVIDNGTWGAGWGIVESGRIGTRNLYSNNIVWGNRRGVALENGHDLGSIYSDPKLLNYKNDGTGDYHLSPSSPAIEAGSQTGAPPIDFDGRTKSAGKPEIGPFQSGERPAVWPFAY